MQKAAIIAHIESSWTSPIILETEKPGSPRFCTDFRKLDAVMKVTNGRCRVSKKSLTICEAVVPSSGWIFSKDPG